MKEITCPLCGAHRNRYLRHVGKYSSYSCTNCDLLFSNPMLAKNNDWYEERARGIGELKVLIPPVILKAIRKISGGSWNHNTFFRKIPLRERLLDLGCGKGEFLIRAKKMGFCVEGVEWDSYSVEIALHNGLDTVHNDSIENFISKTKGSAYYDVITMFEVLEHLENPKGIVKELTALLKPSGYLCISVPRHDRRPKLFDTEADCPPHHLTLWSETSLKTLFKELGFGEYKILESPLSIKDILPHIFIRLSRREYKDFLYSLLLLICFLPLKLTGKTIGHTLLAIAKAPKK